MRHTVTFRQMIEDKLDELLADSPDRRKQAMELPGGSRARGHARSGFAKAIASGRGLRVQPADPGAALKRELRAALERMDEGVFGECESCRRPIPAARLREVPWERHCVKCQGVISGDCNGRRPQGAAENLVNSLFAA